MAGLDRRKHDFDVLEHVLRGMHASSDDMPHLVREYPEAAFDTGGDTELLILMGEEFDDPDRD